MKVRYSLGLEDHLAWYDYYCTTQYGQHEKSKLPVIGKDLDRSARESFGRTISAKNNGTAFGERSLELRTDGVREFSGTYDFVSAWSEIAVVAVTPTHLFIAHVSMNSHIVPLSAFGSSEERSAFIRCAEARGALLEKTPSPESCVRPERSGAVNTTGAEQARGGPESTDRPVK